jgi:hypothetical protein
MILRVLSSHIEGLLVSLTWHDVVLFKGVLSSHIEGLLVSLIWHDVMLFKSYVSQLILMVMYCICSSDLNCVTVKEKNVADFACDVKQLYCHIQSTPKAHQASYSMHNHNHNHIYHNFIFICLLIYFISILFLPAFSWMNTVPQTEAV